MAGGAARHGDDGDSDGDSDSDGGTTMTRAIEVRDVGVTLGGRPVLDGLSFTVPAGQVTGLLGPSGCGKTTLMRCVVGVQRIDRGEVRVLGMPASSPPLRRRVGYVTQTPSVYGDLSAGTTPATSPPSTVRPAPPPTGRRPKSASPTAQPRW
jgi:ABC-type multidrug transport system fused ATPase/permease subunit